MTPTPAADEPEYLKVEEVAARLKLKEKTIRDWILRGELPAYGGRGGGVGCRRAALSGGWQSGPRRSRKA
jgi:excisionase family DNA binding protein